MHDIPLTGAVLDETARPAISRPASRRPLPRSGNLPCNWDLGHASPAAADYRSQEARPAGDCPVVGRLPGHLLGPAIRSISARGSWSPRKRVVEPAVRVEDLQQVLLRCVRPVVLVAVGQLNPGRQLAV